MSTQNQRLSPLRGGGDNFFDYDDGNVQAVVQVYENEGELNLAIYEWSSRKPGNGYSREALAWLGEQFTSICVHGIGEKQQDASAQFWIHQAQQGRVSRLFLDDGTEVVLNKPAKPRLC